MSDNYSCLDATGTQKSSTPKVVGASKNTRHPLHSPTPLAEELRITFFPLLNLFVLRRTDRKRSAVVRPMRLAILPVPSTARGR